VERPTTPKAFGIDVGISHQSIASPQRGRRIPPIANGKSEERPNARDLLATVNSASSGASTSWIAFLGTMAYLAVTLSGVTHVQLLLNEPTTLPFVNVKVPLDTFFVAGPLAFVLLHFGLLLQHVMLSRKLRAFEARLDEEQPSRNRRDQSMRDELHSHPFTQVVSGKPKGAAVDIALRLVMSLTLVVMPLLLLLFFQIGFLPYHSEPITWWHRGMLLADVGVVVILARHIARGDRKTFIIRSVVPNRLVIAVLMFFSICVATLPDTPWDPLDEWMASIVSLREPVPYCRVTTVKIADGKEERTECPEVTSATRHAFYPTALLFERRVNETVGKSDSMLGWSRNLIVTDKNLVDDDKTRLNLRGRDFRYATLDRSHLKRSDFYGAKLAGARLVETDLAAANFRTAELQGANLSGARLQGADLSGARLQGANLSGTSQQGADLSRATLQGANLSGARLQGADLSRATLQGADLSQARLQDADLSQARLQGANLSRTSLQGADLSRASLQGADVSRANLQGANLTLANLQGADVSRVRLHGADLSLTSLQGANLTLASLQGADLSRASLQGADLSWASLQGANLTWASLQGANLTLAALQGADLSGARLQGADLSRASLQGADLSGTKLWKSGAPGDKGAPVGGDAWDLVSVAEMDIRPLDDDERTALGSVGAQLEKLLKEMAKEGASGRERVEAAEKQVAAGMTALLETKDDDKWRRGADWKAWCKLARQPPPGPAKLSTYLGTLACEDDTDRAYMAQRLINRVLGLRGPIEPSTFLEAFKACPAVGYVSADVKSQLERAAQQDREKAGKRQENSEEAEQPTPPEASKICDEPSSTRADNPRINPPSAVGAPPPARRKDVH